MFSSWNVVGVEGVGRQLMTRNRGLVPRRRWGNGPRGRHVICRCHRSKSRANETAVCSPKVVTKLHVRIKHVCNHGYFISSWHFVLHPLPWLTPRFTPMHAGVCIWKIFVFKKITARVHFAEMIWGQRMLLTVPIPGRRSRPKVGGGRHLLAALVSFALPGLSNEPPTRAPLPGEPGTTLALCPPQEDTD